MTRRSLIQLAHMILGVLAVTLIALLPASALAQNKAQLKAQAHKVMTMDYHKFHNFKIRQHPRPFDWSDNGCNTRNWGFGLNLPAGAIHRHYTVLFDWPCEQHDFGYRNYGAGLKLDRSEKARGWIDWRLLIETQRACDNRYRGDPTQRRLCKGYSRRVYQAVRSHGKSAFLG
jgi:hypothetical protein